MKQVLQDVRSGEIAVHDVPEPGAAPGCVLVSVRHSVISAGTERALAGLGSKSLLQKARARPDLVRKTLDTARSEGVGATIAKVRGRLDEYTAFGYSCAGEVLDTGGDSRLAVGMRVACVGQGHASHAEIVSVPSALVVPLPEGVSTADAAFAAPAAIALHAIRLAGVQAGSTVAVVGLGLIGQLAGRLLRASGMRAVGTDPREDRRVLFGEGADEAGIAAAVGGASHGRGADAVLVCAATASSGPVELAAGLARDRALDRGGGRRRPRARPPRLLREGALVRRRPLVRAWTLRPRLRGARPGLPGRARALDGGAERRGRPRPGRLRLAARRRSRDAPDAGRRRRARVRDARRRRRARCPPRVRRPGRAQPHDPDGLRSSRGPVRCESA